MSLPEEACVLRILTEAYENIGSQSPSLSAVEKQLNAMYKDFGQGASRVNNLLEGVFALESQIQVDREYADLQVSGPVSVQELLVGSSWMFILPQRER